MTVAMVNGNTTTDSATLNKILEGCQNVDVKAMTCKSVVSQKRERLTNDIPTSKQPQTSLNRPCSYAF